MAPKKNPPPPGEGEAPPSFEAALERLETIAEELESGELTLEQSIAHYEEGMKLSRRLTQKLDEAEKRIERLVEDESGTPATRPMDLDSAQNDATPRRAPQRDADAEGELPF